MDDRFCALLNRVRICVYIKGMVNLHRALSIFFIAASTFFSLQVMALGLGDIKLDSALNQPLKADIKLIALRGTPMDEIHAKLASDSTFQSAGIERPYFLTKLRFRVATNQQGKPVILVSTAAPVIEPYLHFLIEATWPGGQVYREYTVLLDPAPVANLRKPIQRQAAEASRSAFNFKEGITYGPTKKSDDLYRIALEVKPASSVTIEQTMLAILGANPEAFAKDNVNHLMAGYVLKIPTLQEIGAIPARKAYETIKLQNQRWSEERSKPSHEPVALNKSTSKEKAVRSTQKTPVARKASSEPYVPKFITLTAPQTKLSEASNATANGDVNPKTIQQELLLAEQRIKSLETQNQQLNKQLTQLSSDNSKLKNLLKAQSSRLEKLEAMFADKQASVTATGNKTSLATMASGGQAVALDRSSKNHWLNLVILLGLVVMALLGFFWWWRRREQAVHETDAGEVSFMPPSDDSVTLNEEQADSVEGPVEPQASENPNMDQERESKPAESLTEIDLAKDEVDEPLESSMARHEDDPLEEAGIFLTYQHYTQAERTLLKALEKRPNQFAYWLKLLEVYATQKDLEQFDACCEKMPASFQQKGGDCWSQVQNLRQTTWYASEPTTDGGVASHPPSASTEEEPLLAFKLSGDAPASKPDSDGIDEANVLSVDEADLNEQVEELETVLFSDPDRLNEGEEIVIPENSITLDTSDKAFVINSQSNEEAEHPQQAEKTLNEDEYAAVAGGNLVATKLDLARAFIDMSDVEGAQEILNEVLSEGSESQVVEARTLLNILSSSSHTGRL